MISRKHITTLFPVVPWLKAANIGDWMYADVKPGSTTEQARMYIYNAANRHNINITTEKITGIDRRTQETTKFIRVTKTEMVLPNS